MKVELILHTPEENIGESAKICYNTKSIKDGGKDITEILVHKHKHLASLRFAYATISVDDISIACQNQVVRSKHLDFMVQSKRYVSASKGDFSFVMPYDLNKETEKKLQYHFDKSVELYKELINSGIKKEDARSILPANTSTKMNITGNLQAWNDFFKLRLSSHAQKEIRKLANEIYNLLKEVYPKVFTETLRKTFSI
jgi:thymidylate synthase (FAD)